MDTGTLFYLLGGCLALGMLHGVIPDEHTWPITFAYSVGTTTGKGGVRAGGFFSLAFTAQRALMSALVFFALYVAASYFGFAPSLATSDSVNGPVYIVVGLAMAIAGYLILTDRIPHFHPFLRVSKRDLARHTAPAGAPAPGGENVPVHWAIIHGFISGFGTDSGILSVWIYVYTIPFLVKNGLWQVGWLPGALFGLGTFVVLMLIGFFFGETLQVAKRWGTYRVAMFGRLVGARTLLLGGLVFIALGPPYYFGLADRLPVDFGTFIVLLVLVAIAVPIMYFTWRQVRRMPRVPPAPGVPSSPGASLQR